MSMPGECMSTRKYVIPWCFGTSGSVRARQMPQWARAATDVHTFWPVSDHPPSTLVARVGSGREVRAGARLAEELAPDDVAPHRRPDEPLGLLVGAVGDDRRQRPGGHGEGGPLDPRLGERLVDDQLLDGPGVTPQGDGQWGASSPWSARARWRSASSSMGTTSASSPSISARRASASGGRSTVRRRRHPARASRADSARSGAVPPTSWRSVVARRRWTWASCSQVKPIPPRTWMAPLAAST